MNVLVACEESQEVCKAFRERGHRAFSCDIQECSGGHPEWHIKGDVLPIINGYKDPTEFFITESGEAHSVPKKWDLIIAHPPCTYLTVTGNAWFEVSKYGDKARERYRERYKAIVFFMQFALADCPRIAIENPVGIMSSCYKKPEQIIQPYMFGDPYEKKTCLWLKGLCALTPTDIVTPPPRRQFESGKSMPEWYAKLWHLPAEERAKARSKTPPGLAKAMSEQWGGQDNA